MDIKSKNERFHFIFVKNMSNEQKYNEFLRSTTDSFNEWNSQQEPTDKIYYRVPFTLTFPNVKMLAYDKKESKDKEGKPIVTEFRKFKMISASGTEVSYRVQSPSVIAKRGLCLIKTKSGSLLSIPCTYDIRNPEHARFLDEYEKKIILPSAYEILKEPGRFSIDNIDPVSNFDEETVNSQEFQFALRTAKNCLAKFSRFPKKDATTFDIKSPLRTVFYNPSNYLPKDDQETGSSMSVKIMLAPGQPPLEVTLLELQDLCAGIVVSPEGKKTKGTPKGFECSPELNVIKLHVAKQASNKGSCAAIFISRFQEAPKMDSQEEKVKYFDSMYESGDSYTIQSDISSLIEGLRRTATNSVTPKIPEGTGFNPMGIDSNSGNSSLPTIGKNDGSFLSNVEKPINQSLSLPTNNSYGEISPSIPHQQVQNFSQHTNVTIPNNTLQIDQYQQMANFLPPPVQMGQTVYPSMQFNQGQIPNFGQNISMPTQIPGMNLPGISPYTSSI